MTQRATFDDIAKEDFRHWNVLAIAFTVALIAITPVFVPTLRSPIVSGIGDCWVDSGHSRCRKILLLVATHVIRDELEVVADEDAGVVAVLQAISSGQTEVSGRAIAPPSLEPAPFVVREA